MEKHLKVAESLVNLLDTKYKIFNFRFGLDPLLGIVPGLGDVLPALLGAYLIYIGKKLDLPREKISKMVANLVTDVVLGMVPIIGDVSDFVFKSNVKNLEIIREHLKGQKKQNIRPQLHS